MAYPLQKLGLVAGGGQLPRTVQAYCDRLGIECYTIGFEAQTDPQTLDGRPHLLTRLGAAGRIIRDLREKGYNDLVIIGAVKRPRLRDLRPDLKTAGFFAKLGLRALGDDGLLKAVRAELESEGFVIHAIQDLMPELLMPSGILTTLGPNAAQAEAIRKGLAASRVLGEADIGQSVVVDGASGAVLGTEDANGTNALIRRAGRAGAILVKSAKPQQDRTLDMPTLGSHSVRACAELGYAGIAAEAGGVLLADRAEMVAEANTRGLFVVGV